MNTWTYGPISKNLKNLLMSMMAITIVMTLYFMKQEQMYILEWEFTSMNNLLSNLPILVDKKTMTFSSAVFMISFSVMMFSMSYMANEQNVKYFTIMVMLFISSMMILIFIPHTMMLLLGWDGLGITSYLLVIFYLNKNSLSAGMITVMTNRLGDAFLIIMSAWLFTTMFWHMNLTSLMMTMFIMINLISAAMTKSAQMPFSAWLPAAMAAPTPVSALVHSSTLVTAGIYLTLRFYSSLSSYTQFSIICFIAGTMTSLMAGTTAMQETDFKKIIALSTLSQLGIMMMTIGLNQPSLTLFHLITHAMFKALLFICAGTIMHNNSNNQDIRFMGNISLSMPTTSMTLNTANLSLCGIPLMAGFYSKDTIIEMLMTSNKSLVMMSMMLISIWLTSLYTTRVSLHTLWSPFKGQKMVLTSDTSKPTYIAYVTLLSGTIMGGTVFLWSMNPQMQLPNMPSTMKMLTLVVTLTSITLMYTLLMKNSKMGLTNQMTSMWFIKHLSTNSVNKQMMKLMKILIYNELTWMEKLSGKGMKKMTSLWTKGAQYTTNTHLSQFMSMTMLTMIFLLLMIQ
nr:NADH dehydrogenase subunit 5 [Discoporella cookae]